MTTEINVWLPPSGGMAGSGPSHPGSGSGSGSGSESGGDDGTTVTTTHVETVFVGTEIYTTNTVQCTGACIIVLPPSPLASTTTISIPNYTTSVQIGSDSTSPLTITIPDVTISSVPYYNINITSGQSICPAFVPTPSIALPPVTIGLPGPDGTTTSRIITLPPWPSVTQGPPENWTSQNDPCISTWSLNVTNTVTPSTAPPLTPTASIDTITIRIPFQNTTWNFATRTGSTNPTLSFGPTSSPFVVQCPSSASTTEVDFSSGYWIATFDCPTTTTLEFSCSPTSTVVEITSTSGVFSQDCEFASVVPVPSADTQTVTPTTSSTFSSVSPTLPVWTEWPNVGQILPLSTPIPTPAPPQTIPCDIWFFFVSFTKDKSVRAGLRTDASRRASNLETKR